MRTSLILLAMAGLAACSPPVPDSGAGVGFGSYDEYQEGQIARDRQLRRGSPVVSGPLAAEQSGSAQQTAAPQTTTPQTEAQATAAAAVAAIQPGETPQQAGTFQTAGIDADTTQISDEQDFDAVSSRQTIQSDAQRRAQQSAQYRVVQPTAVPERPADRTPTPIEFALQVQHPLGFLKAGGPEKDKLKLDPDGDGYACAWNPGKYRQLVRN